MKCILLYIFLARRVYDPVCCREIGINCSCTINYSFSKESSYCIKTNRIYYCFIRKIWKIEKKKYPKFILKIYKYTKNERKVWRNSYVTIWKYYFSFSLERVSIFYREISKPWPCLVLIPAKRRPSFFSFLFFRLARRGRRGETAPRDPGLVKRNKLVNSGAYGERESLDDVARGCVMRFAVWAQGDFRDEVTGGLARLDLTGHGAHTPGGSNPSTPGATPTTPSGGFSTAQPRSRTNTTHRPDIRKGTPRQFTTNFSNPRPSRLSSKRVISLSFSSSFFFLFLGLLLYGNIILSWRYSRLEIRDWN